MASAYAELELGLLDLSSFMKTLKASLAASVIGTGAWMLGFTRAMWPAHPQVAAFFLTVVATFVLLSIWPEPRE